jgi:serine/threonine protein kinase
MTLLKTWIDIKIENGDIKYFEYDNFSNIKEIGRGAFGIVNKANWNDGGIRVALKSPLNNSTSDEEQKENFLKEVSINQVFNFEFYTIFN